MKINDVAKLTNVTVRTLQYYDKIGLLKPNEVTDSKYRIYNKDNLETLQQILFFKELDFPLKEIKEIMRNPNYDKEEALKNQMKLLKKKRQHIDGLIGLVENTLKGEEKMSFQEFDMTEIENAKKKYAKEAKERWGGSDAYRESEEKTKKYDKAQWQELTEAGNAIMAEFAECKGESPESEAAQTLVKEWKAHISKYFYHCTNEILSGLGQMYIADERFKDNINQHGDGTAEFMSAAIQIYCSSN